jgi:8-oxo-dGTP pyrophosphatase MutT (NUDIX family)
MKRLAKIIFYNKNKFLLQLRDKNESNYPHTWVLLGGNIDENETPIQTLKRELIEELSFENFTPKFLFTKIRETNGVKVEDNIFCAEVSEEILKHELKEGEKIAFLSIDEIKKTNVFEPFKEYLIEFAIKQK